MANYVCDLCGFQSEDRAAILAHFASEHSASEPAEVGSVTQEDGRLILRSGADVTAVDLDAWLGAYLAKTPATHLDALWDITNRLAQLPVHKRGAVLRALDSFLAALEYKSPADADQVER